MTKYWRPRVCSDDVTTTGFPHVAMSQKETTTSDREEELLRLNTTPDSAHCAAERESICDYSLAHCAACNTQLL